MCVNHKKCAVTGMLHSDPSPLSSKTVEQLRNRLADVTIIDAAGQPQAIPFCHPDNEPYKYLGVLLTPSLNWKHQIQALVEEVTERGNALLHSMASPLQRLQVLEHCIKPYIAYSFPTGAKGIKYLGLTFTQRSKARGGLAKLTWQLRIHTQ